MFCSSKISDFEELLPLPGETFNPFLLKFLALVLKILMLCLFLMVLILFLLFKHVQVYAFFFAYIFVNLFLLFIIICFWDCLYWEYSSNSIYRGGK